MKKLLTLGVIIASLIAVAFWYYSDEKVVLRKSHKLMECFEKEEGDGLLSGVLSEDKFRDLLDKSVALDFDHKDMPDMKGGIKQERAYLAQSYLYMMKSAKYIKLSDQSIELESIEDKAAKVKITVHGEVKHSRKSISSNFTLLLDYSQTDEGWRISGITVKKE